LLAPLDGKEFVTVLIHDDTPMFEVKLQLQVRV
jgi:hypothetical protein